LLFAAIWKTVQKAINFISYVLLATAIFFAVAGILFPFVLRPQRNHGFHRALRDRHPHIHRRRLSTAFGYAHVPFAPAL
jgi:hypothetical protein